MLFGFMEEIWSGIENKLLKFIFSKVKDESAAKDILQEVFIRMHSNIGSLKDQTKIHSWIYSITRNLITDYFRKSKSKSFNITESDEITEESDIDEIMSETVQDMIKMMNQLSPEYCEALCLTEIQGMSTKEYSIKIGISYSGAKSRVQRARALLKDALMNCCHYEFDKYGTVIAFHPIACCCCKKNI